MQQILAKTQKRISGLRRKGLSHRDIAKQLHISLGSAFFYSKSVRITAKQHSQLIHRGLMKGIAHLSNNEKKKASYLGGKHSHKYYQTPYSKERIIHIIQEFVASTGRIPLKRELGIYRQAIRYFDTWNNAIHQSGYSPNPVLFAKKYIANDGHKCDSLAEKIIDDWLSARKISHQRNIPYLKTRYTADFMIGNTYIEFFGLHKQLHTYDLLMRRKIRLIKRNRLQLIAIYPKDLFPLVKLDRKL